MVVREKLQEEIFGRISKNLKWLEALLNTALDCADDGEGFENETEAKSKEILLRQIDAARQSLSTAFVPVLTSIYPHKYEVSEIFWKYVTASYRLATEIGEMTAVTKELWQETLPDDSLGVYADSEKRISEILMPAEKNRRNTLVRHVYVAVRNLCANVDQLETEFKEETYVASFVGLLKNRMMQIEYASSAIYKLFLNKTLEENKITAVKTEMTEVNEVKREFFIERKVHLTNFPKFH